MHYLLFYEVADDYLTRRAEFRNIHLKMGWEAAERGELFKGDSPEVAEKFARADPYVANGVVKRWHVREWTTVVGDLSANPKRP